MFIITLTCQEQSLETINIEVLLIARQLTEIEKQEKKLCMPLRNDIGYIKITSIADSRTQYKRINKCYKSQATVKRTCILSKQLLQIIRSTQSSKGLLEQDDAYIAQQRCV